MTGSAGVRRLAAALGTALAVASGPASSGADIGDVMQQVGLRVQAYYERFQSLICVETVEQQRLARDLMPEGDRQEFTYELRIEPQVAAEGRQLEFAAMRTLQRINGRAPRGDREPECLDPQESYSEPLLFLMPEQQPDYAFKLLGPARLDDLDALVIEFSAVRSDRPRVSWKENCFSMSAAGHTRGRLWVSAATYDVLQIESRLQRPLSFALPREMRTPAAGRLLTLERVDSVVRYRPIAFNDPDETLTLPVSVDTVTVVQGAATPRMRVRQSFRGYQRFLTRAIVR
jgi:hypothetical protein